MRCLAFISLLIINPAVLAAGDASTATATVVPGYQEPFSAQALMQLVLGLVLVVLLILGLSWLLRRFSNMAPSDKSMRVLCVLPLGTREKAVLIQAGDKQILLGVAPGRVSLLSTFDEPVIVPEGSAKGFAQRLSEAISQQKGDKGAS